MHYAVPRVLSEAALLERFYTDFCASKGWPRLLHLVPNSMRPDSVRRLLDRSPKGVDPARIVAFNAFGREYARRRRSATTPTGQTASYLWAGREFCRLVLEGGLDAALGVYCFNSAALEILQRARLEGRQTVLEQIIAPKRIERQILMEEANSFTGWETAQGRDALADDFIAREEAEWAAADTILCGSQFVVDSIRQLGGPVEKCVVVPYGVELPGHRGEDGRQMAVGVAEDGKQKAEDRRRPLRVLTVGAVGLRKGSPYVLEAAKQLKGQAVFRMVGSIAVTREAETKLREHLELTGAVPRSEIAKHFLWADVFLLPSLCEGSATVTYEALGYGLPVVCTPNTGSVVRDGVEGFIVPARDVNAMVERLQTLAQDYSLLKQLRLDARMRAEEYTLAEYSHRVVGTLQGQSRNSES